MTPSSSVPSWMGIPLKYISLMVLTVQNSSLILVMRYSRTMPGYDESGRYFVSTAVLLNEVLKLLICIAIRLHSVKSIRALLRDVLSDDIWHLAVPAFLYTLQNGLQFIAVSNLDAPTFQVTYQMKILTTAFFSVALLKRTLTIRQWVSLLLLVIGIALVQIPSEAIVQFFSGPTTDKPSDKLASVTDTNQYVGLLAVAVACVLSGLAGVYFEMVLKRSKASVWTRNIQLSFFSLFPALFIGVIGNDGANVREKGFFHGYNYVVWLSIVLQAIGGLIVALCVKYADNIAKNFATSISIIISCVVSLLFFADFELTSNLLVGASFVLYATFLYSKTATSKELKPKASV
ncbi:hypothetical protein TRVA0_029S00210 [Trichomonascus vanleenenianus]|uniref:uncharacterized protein n=1 Tax=Trichomonascus vanleenenianus TaxID=2268995 RepID=UPI003ECAE91F